MHVDIAPRRVAAVPGAPSEFLVTITNTTEVISGYSLRALGVDPEWVTCDAPEPRLFPGESTTAQLTLRLPDRSPAGDRAVAIQVTDLGDPSRTIVEEAIVEVAAAPHARVDLDPATVTAGRSAGYSCTVSNEGNTVQLLRLEATDPEDRTSFDFQPREVRLGPGASTTVDLTAKARRPFLGDAALRPFTVRATGPGIPEGSNVPAAAGMFVQRPRLSRAALGLIGLIAAITVFATIITIALSSIVQQSAADRDLALQVAQAREQEPETGRSDVSGSVIEIGTGATAPGVSVELFPADDASTPMLSTATDDEGQFSLIQLPAGEFLLRVRGAGFAEVWYPTAATAADATPLTLDEGGSIDDLTVVVGGVPAQIAGTVSGDDVSGASLRVELPLDEEPLDGGVEPATDETAADGTGGGALVRSVPISEDGTFEVADLPSPGVYDLVVSKPGFATSIQRIDLSAGERRDDIALNLALGDGSITGTIDGPDGPISGAAIVATSGETRVETVSLTEGETGGFVLRDLPTPGTYTIAVSADGYASASLTVSLTPGQQFTGVDVVLGPDQGTLGGTVTLDGGGAGGVLITVSDGATTLQTVSRSTQPTGAWELAGVPLPGDYTVTFARQDVESRVLSVSVDAFGVATSHTSATSIDVALRSATASLSGQVRQTRGDGPAQPVGNVVVTVSSGAADRVVTTASVPAAEVGHYRIDNLPPGTYTVTFTRSGTRPTSEIIELDAAQHRTLDPVLVAPARIEGTVTTDDGPLADGSVSLYRANEYGTSAAPVARTSTDGSGRYVIENIAAPENYVVEVRTSTGSIAGTSPPFTLEASEDRTLDISVTIESEAGGS
ncbi:carboxypeptidase regulatory-like domain-containing protein [Ruania alba]|uniref:alpha-amylase n=1 Tax=Ruania alba TaxID=648782 RepID=A0A1H5KMZ6_9MICO|nr:carboxypeptidase regulatory-like domain-containing protein [Ruania alba]SEE66050.1 Carboxypeptidase regulatory-like domain-containing protein [Ruania alba]